MKFALPFLLSTLTLGISLSSTAEESYACLHEGSERIIRVTYDSPDSPVPCQVVYEKASGSQILWSAQNEAGYCESQAEAFAEKQRSWGWDCTKMEVPTAESSEQPAGTTPSS